MPMKNTFFNDVTFSFISLLTMFRMCEVLLPHEPTSLWLGAEFYIHIIYETYVSLGFFDEAEKTMD
jgi:hypothetical protein